MMRNIIRNWTACIGMVVTLAACDDYLDITPKGKALLKSTEDYLGLIEDRSPEYDMMNSWILAGEASWYKAEELKSYTNPLNSVAYFWDESYDRAGDMIENTAYNACYDRITKFNVVVDGIASSEGKEEDKRMGEAQARVLRAYNYFFLINTFARPYDPATAYQTHGIIVREKMFESLEDVGIQQSVGYTYDFIQRDIEAAIPDLPHKATNSFRPDKTFGYAFKAKVHLFRREFEQCIEACDSALAEAARAGHELWDMTEGYNTFAPMLVAAGYPEMAIDEPQYAGVNDFVENVWKTRIPFEYDAPEQLLYQFGSTYTDPYPMYVPKQVLDLFQKDADLRYRYCIRYKAEHETAPAGDSNFSTLAIKWNPGGMRLSEVYLMLAECYARKGNAADLSKAMGYMETLRACRMVPGRYQPFAPTDAEEALRLVREERKRELFLTCNGFFDLRRFATEFNETQTRVIEGKTYTLSPASHLLTYPFPLKAMQTSNLIQNSK